MTASAAAPATRGPRRRGLRVPGRRGDVTGELVTGIVVTGELVTGPLVTGELVTGALVRAGVVTSALVTAELADAAGIIRSGSEWLAGPGVAVPVVARSRARLAWAASTAACIRFSNASGSAGRVMYLGPVRAAPGTRRVSGGFRLSSAKWLTPEEFAPIEPPP